MRRILLPLMRVAAILSLLAMMPSSFAQRAVTAGNWDATTSSAYGGFHCTSRYSWTQTIYPVSELGTQAGWVRAILLDNRSTVDFTLDSAKIYLAQSAMTEHPTTASVGTWLPQSDLHLVWSRTAYTIPASTSGLLIVLDEPFYYSGDSSLVVVFSKAASASSSNTKFGYTSTTRAYKYTGGTTESYCRYPTVAGTHSTYKQNMQFYMTDNQNDMLCLPVELLTATGATTHTMTAQWHNPGGDNYEVGYAAVGDGYNSSNLVPYYTTDSTYTFTNLDANTAHWFYVRRACDATTYSAWDSVLIRTTMQAQPLPISYDFEDTTRDADWAITNGPNGWYMGAHGSYGTGNRGMYISNDNGASQAYAIASSAGYSWAWIDVELETAGAYVTSFDWRAQGETNYDYLRVMLVPASAPTFSSTYGSNPTANTFIAANSPAGWINLSTTPDGVVKLNLDSTWNHFSSEIVITPEQLGTYHLTFIWVNDGGGGTQPPAAVDNIEFYMTSCSAPVSCTLDSTELSATTASLDVTHLTGSLDFYMRYHPTGADNWMEASTSTGSFSLTGLQPGTQYECLIQTICGSDTSSGMLPFEFITECAPLDLPLVLDAEHVWLGTATAPSVPCWTFVNGGSSTYNWRPGTTASNAHEGVRYYYYYGSTTANPTGGWGDWMITPVINFTGNEEIVFWARTSTTTSTDSYHGRFYFYATNDTEPLSTDTNDFQRLTVTGDVTNNMVDFVGNTWQMFTVQMPSSLTGQRRLAFVVPKQSYTFYMDDITISTRSSCATAYDVYAHGSYMGPDSATIMWSDSAGASSYTVSYWPDGAQVGDTVTVTVYDTLAQLTGLTQNTVYYVSVVSHCSSEDANASFPITFRTLCSEVPATSLPYVENFEAYGSGSSAAISPCWTKGTNSSVAYPYPYSTAAINGTRGLYLYGTNSSSSEYYSYAALPRFESEINTLKLNFKTKKHATASTTTTYYGLTVVVGVMSNPYDITTLDTVAIIDRLHDGPSSIDSHEVSFEHYTGQGSYIALYAPSVPRGSFTTLNNAAYVDDIVVDLLPACRRPEELAVSNLGTDEATLTWRGSASEFLVEYDTAASFANALQEHVSNDTTLTLHFLENFTQYWFRVRGICGSDSSDWSLTATGRTLLDCGTDYENAIDTLERGTSTSYSYAIGNYYSYAYQKSWHIYTLEDLMGMGLMDSLNLIHSIALETGLVTRTDAFPFRIYMAETTLNEWPSTGTSTSGVYDTIPIDSMTLVYDGEYAFKAFSWNEIVLDSAFAYSGTRNLVVAFVRDQPLTGTQYVYFKYISTLENYQEAYTYQSTTSSSANTYRYKYGFNTMFNICKHVPDCSRPTNVTIASYTDSSLTLTWDGYAPSYELVVTNQPTNPDTASSEQIVFTQILNDDSITVFDLTQQTTYYFYLRSICGYDMSDWTIEQSITTMCAPRPLPYREDFDSYPATTTATGGQTIDPCWNKGTTSATAYPYIYTTNYYSAPNGMYFYATTTAHSWAALPPMADSVNNLLLSFMMKKTTESYGKLRVGIMTDPTDISTFILYRHATVTELGNWMQMEVDFSDYSGPQGVIAFLLPDSATNHAMIDDIVVRSLGSCHRPSNVTVTNITGTTATVKWTDANQVGNYEVEYGPRGFELGTGTTLATTDDSLTITGLVIGEEYEVVVRTICSSGTDTSLSTLPVRFYTNCDPRPLPIFIDFEGEATGSGATVPRNPCWTITNNASATNTYRTYPYINTGAANAHSGTKFLYFYLTATISTGNPTYQIFSGPQIDTISTPINNVEVNFWAKRSTNRTNLEVGVMTDPSDASTFTPVDTVKPGTTMEEFTVSMEGFTGQGSYISFRLNRDTAAALYIYLDDISITPLPTCPRSTDLSATNATPSSASLMWTDTIGSTQWKIELTNLTTGAVDTVTATTNPYTATGLTAATLYAFRVAPICSDGQMSEFSREQYTFSTSQIPAAVPYNYNFEDENEWLNWQTSSNNNVNWYRGNVARDNNTYALYISNDGGLTHSWNMSAVTNIVAYRDIDFGNDTGSYQIEFDAYLGGTIGYGYEGIAVIVTDPTLPVVSSSINITSPWGNVNNVSLLSMRHDTLWGHYVARAEGLSGVKRLAFYHFNQATGSSYDYEDNPSAIDNISVVPQACGRAYNLTVQSTTHNSADLSWQGDTTGVYVIDYRPTGTTGTDLFDTVTGLSHTLTGLEPDSSYWVWVRHLCSDSIFSAWTTNVTVATRCMPVSAYDTIREDFEGVTTTTYSTEGLMPDCWKGYHTGSNLYVPHVVTGGGTYGYRVNGNGSISMVANGQAVTSTSRPTYGDAYVSLPNFLEPTNTLTLAYWFCTSSSSYGKLEVGYLDGTNPSADFVTVKTLYPSTQSMYSGTAVQTTRGIRDTVSFADLPDGNYVIGFKWTTTSPTSTTLYAVCIDDVSVWSSLEPASCDLPVVTLSDVTYQSATVSASSTATSYELLYGLDQQTLGSTMSSTNGVFNLTGLMMDTTYYLSLRAVCDGGVTSEWVDTFFTTPMQPCATPTAVTVTNIDFTAATIGWSAGNDGSSWQVHIAGTGTDTIIDVAIIPFTYNMFDPGVTYTVEVRTVCGPTVSSPWSTAQTFTTNSCQEVSSVTVSDTTEGGATITWTASPNSNGTYQVEYGTMGFAQGTGTRVTVTTNSYTITGLMDMTTYSVYVRSVCAEGIYSTWSPEVRFTTLESDPDITYYNVNVVYDATMGSVSGAGRYAEGTVVTLTATSNTGYHFVEWSEDHMTDSVRTFTLTSDMTFTAVFAANVGIEDVPTLGTSLVLYPNPASTTVTLGGLQGGEQVELIDLQGRVRSSHIASQSVFTIDVSQIPQGTYYVRVTGDRDSAIRKLIVK